MGRDLGALVTDLLDAADGSGADATLRTRLIAAYGGPLPDLAGVVGWPLTYTLSPRLHNYWCERYGIRGQYLSLPIASENFEHALRRLAQLGFRGVNVTIPHKEMAYRCASIKTPAALRAGAVNTIIFTSDGEIRGDCTDGEGLCAHLAAHGVMFPKRVLLIGAGGASRAIAAALLDRGCVVALTNRTQERAQNLVRALAGGKVIAWEEWPSALAQFDLLINATSLGMKGQALFDWDSTLTEAPDRLIVADIVYVPLMTPLLCAAQRRGLKTLDGLGMLLHQAVLGFSSWFGVTPEVDDATKALMLRAGV